MSTSIRRNLLLITLFCNQSALFAPTPQNKKPKAPKRATKFFTVGAKHKDQIPLSFSIKKTLTGKEKKIALKKYKALDRKPTKLMTEKELRSIADLALQLGYKAEAVTFLTRLMVLLKSTLVIKNLKLKIADINFDRGALKLAGQEYEEFLKLYPGDKKAEYAQYKGLLSNFYTMLSADRDQTPTLNTISLADAFLEKNELYKQYNKDVQEIRTSCYYALYDNEVTIFEYYLKKGSNKAAETRLASLRKSYQTLLPDTEPKILHMEYRVALAKNEPVRAKNVYAKLEKKFPTYTQRLALTHKPKSKKNYVAFF